MNKIILPAQYVLLVAALLIAGCTTIDRKPQTVEESLYITAAYGKSLTLSASEAYVRRLITKEQQLAALDELDKARDITEAALVAYAIGRYDKATDGLGRAEAIIRSIATLLTQAGYGVPTQ